MSTNSNYLSSFTATNTSNTDILSQINYGDYILVYYGSFVGNVAYFDMGNTRIVYSNGYLITEGGGRAEVIMNVGFGNIPTAFCNGYSNAGYYRVNYIAQTPTTTQIDCQINSGVSGMKITFFIIGLKP